MTEPSCAQCQKQKFINFSAILRLVISASQELLVDRPEIAKVPDLDTGKILPAWQAAGDGDKKMPRTYGHIFEILQKSHPSAAHG